MNRPITVGITHGDYNGVGYEVIMKALEDEKILELMTPVVFGSQEIWEKCRRELGLEMPDTVFIKNAAEAKPGRINVVNLKEATGPLTPGIPSKESGMAAVVALEAATEALKEGQIRTLVTAPICKTAVQSETFNFPGHTEYLQDRLAGEEDHARMILFDDHLRVALVTTHLSLGDVPAAITREAVETAIRGLDRTLKSDFTCERPKIAVLSLNPHNGDNGLLGKEEQDVIIPAIDSMLEDGILAFGPYPADGFFATGAWKNYDGVIAMYHDQGLAPFKTIAGEHGVNFTAGLPYVRTSPDHGTAYDIAWRGDADPTSMREAIYKSMDILRARERYRRASANPLRKTRLEKGQDKTIDLSKETL